MRLFIASRMFDLFFRNILLHHAAKNPKELLECRLATNIFDVELMNQFSISPNWFSKSNMNVAAHLSFWCKGSAETKKKDQEWMHTHQIRHM